MSSFGETLKRERELRQITLREISEATKINLRYLDALERNEFRHLPGGVFNKGFVRAYAQHIGIDPEAMVDAYLEEIREQEERSQPRERERPRRGAAYPPVPPEGKPPQTGDEGRGARRAAAAVVAIALVALLAAAGWAGWRYWWTPRRAGAATAAQAGGVALPAEAGAQADPPEAGAEAAPVRSIVARVVVDRPVDGAITCDGETVLALRDLEAGVPRDVSCAGALALDATDGGAVRVGVDGAEPAPSGPDGAPLSGFRLRAEPRTAEPESGARP